MPDFKPPELTDLETRALGIAIQIALCQITGVDHEIEASLAVFRENQDNLLLALTTAHHKVGQSLGAQTECIIGIQCDGSGNIQTTLTKLDAGPERDQAAPHEDEGNRHRRW